MGSALVSASLRRPLQWAASLTLLLSVGFSFPAVTFFAKPEYYLPLHLALEFVAMATSFMVFALGWSLRRLERNSHVAILAFASLAIALVDMAHTLSYQGMPEFFTASDPEKAINFWLIGRTIAALGFIAIALLPIHHWPDRLWPRLFAAILALVGIIWWIGLFRVDWIPHTYIEGQGLTSFKVGFEYLLSSLYAAAALLLFRRARIEGGKDTAWLAAAAWTLALAELFFTLYANVTDLFNLLGHVYKAIAYLMVYRAVFVAGVQAPYLQLAAEKSRLRSLIDSVPDLIFFKDRNGSYLGANRAFEKYSGLGEDELIGKSDLQLAEASLANQYRERDLAVLSDGKALRSEEWVPFKGGGGGLFDTVKTPYYGPDGETLGLVGISRDITEHKRAEQRIQHLAHFDQLTGLPNRLLLTDRVTQAVSVAQRSGGSLALIFLDLDDFKTINDTIGHNIGDLLLKQLGQRITATVRDEDTVSRLGGDEFILLLRDVGADGATHVAEKLIQTISQPFHIEQYELTVTSSVGVALYPDDGQDFEALMRCADAAMYRAKQEGRNTYRFYTGDMQARSARRLQLASALRRAIANDELELYYQPQIDLADGRIDGVEALVRWQHPQYGLLAPDEFISLAEDSGLIVPLGEWVLHTALTQAKAWQDAGHPLATVAVNLSAVQFRQNNLPQRIAAILDAVGFPAERLEIELTESVAMRNAETAVEMMERLHATGVRLSIDDFGTGYSSLSYLKRFRIDRLKIDRSFVQDLGTDADDEAIVQAIIHLARSLRFRTIAEGVESEQQLNFLRHHGCDAVQGFYFSKPLPAAQMLMLLQSQPFHH